MQFKQFRQFFESVHVEAFYMVIVDAYDFLRLVQSHLRTRTSIDSISRPRMKLRKSTLIT